MAAPSLKFIETNPPPLKAELPWPYVVEEFPASALFSAPGVGTSEPQTPKDNPDRKEVG